MTFDTEWLTKVALDKAIEFKERVDKREENAKIVHETEKILK